ncbi:amidohydrolase family protein [Bosea sp. (in: a-proteobacteria)]|jgi:aminocarboxymuconate-semialdehyde decarboxylase|uniref:amidohydrolase family protein n=1 Tax=Bosea sp. (in: a-proteobacteria) TaxID=1871050 RepID=UPI002DDCA32B|nr:amidohydrolase family protein [Bosea sp. (in: a-proteobacteria)]HEV2508410.1 amidohydrolase family protein [Bosea sp. (in: a-proteobacteria)]
MSVQRIALDVHAHLIPIGHEGVAEAAGVSWDPAAEKLVIDGHAIGIKALFHPEALIAWMDQQGVERAWISVPPPTYRPGLDAAQAEAWTRALNDGLVAIAAARPDRLEPLFHLPVAHPELAARIVRERAAAGAARFAMPTGEPGLMLSDASHAPLWQALDKASAFVFLHPGEGCDGRLDPFYLHNLLGNPNETAIAAGHLIFAGILECHPRITVCLAHAGGTLPAVAGRWQQGFGTSRPGVDTSVEAPAKALRRFCVDCIAHDPALLDLAQSVFGADRIVFGSDWPFPMGLMKPHEQLVALSDECRRAIFCDNPEKLSG